jgi:hypothetical protein
VTVSADVSVQDTLHLLGCAMLISLAVTSRGGWDGWCKTRLSGVGVTSMRISIRCTRALRLHTQPVSHSRHEHDTSITCQSDGSSVHALFDIIHRPWHRLE